MSVTVVGHEGARALLREVRAHSLLFVGAPSVGRLPTARWFAAWLNCAADGPEPCGRCESCRTMSEDRHPDLMVKRPGATTREGRAARRPVLRIDQMVPRTGPRADPEPLSRWLEGRPRYRRRVGVVDDAHTLNVQAANAFLKMLEEPPSWATIVLIAPSPASVLPTLASRCVPVRFTAAPTAGFEDLAPHPALRAGQRGRLLRAREEPEADEAVQEAVRAWVAALDGPLGPALAAAGDLVKVWTDHPDEVPAERLLEHVRRDAPHRYRAALEAVHEAEEALRAYVSPAVVGPALTLRVRSGR